MPNSEEFDEKGTEMSPNVLFGDQEKMFMALMLNRLHKDKLEPSLYLQKMTKAHLNRGVIALYPRINNLSDFYELIKEER